MPTGRPFFEWPQQSELFFFQELTEELGIDQEDVLIVQRDIKQAGKTICRVNGRTVTLANLRKIGLFLVDIQGQTNIKSYYYSRKGIFSLVDGFGDDGFKEELLHYQDAYQEYRNLEKQVRNIQENEQLYVQRMDMLRFQQEEIAQAELIEGEEENLIEEREKLTNYQKSSMHWGKVMVRSLQKK